MLLKISKGNHKNFRLPKITFRKKIEGTIAFLGDMSYEIDRQFDTNKVVGLSDSWNHLRHSVRIGWRWYRGELQVMALIHRRKKIGISYLMTVEENKEYPFLISIEKDSYKIMFDNKEFQFERVSRWNFLRYYLFPYFGGTTKAPKEFKFKITVKNK